MASNSATKLASQQSIKAYVDAAGIGVGQTWQDVGGSRSAGTSYQNTTGKPIMVAIRGNTNSTHYLQVSTDNATWISVGSTIAANANMTAIVPMTIITGCNPGRRSTGGRNSDNGYRNQRLKPAAIAVAGYTGIRGTRDFHDSSPQNGYFQRIVETDDGVINPKNLRARTVINYGTTGAEWAVSGNLYHTPIHRRPVTRQRQGGGKHGLAQVFGGTPGQGFQRIRHPNDVTSVVGAEINAGIGPDHPAAHGLRRAVEIIARAITGRPARKSASA